MTVDVYFAAFYVKVLLCISLCFLSTNELPTSVPHLYYPTLPHIDTPRAKCVMLLNVSVHYKNKHITTVNFSYVNAKIL